jgi:hypothetical protein
MTESRVKFGLTLPNRGVVIGATTAAEMLQRRRMPSRKAGIRCGLGIRLRRGQGNQPERRQSLSSLQVRPSRSINAMAAEGPQLPAG